MNERDFLVPSDLRTCEVWDPSVARGSANSQLLPRLREGAVQGNWICWNINLVRYVCRSQGVDESGMRSSGGRHSEQPLLGNQRDPARLHQTTAFAAQESFARPSW
jgi:hypothetical protein